MIMNEKGNEGSRRALSNSKSWLIQFHESYNKRKNENKKSFYFAPFLLVLGDCPCNLGLFFSFKQTKQKRNRENNTKMKNA